MNRINRHLPQAYGLEKTELQQASSRAVELVSVILSLKGDKSALITALMVARYQIFEDKKLREIMQSPLLTESERYALALKGVTSTKEAAEGVVRSIKYLGIANQTKRYEIFRLGAHVAPNMTIQCLQSATLSPAQNLEICKIAASRIDEVDTKEFLQKELQAKNSGSAISEEKRKFDLFYGQVRREHLDHHILRHFEDVLESEESFFDGMSALMARDPLGTLLFLQLYPRTRLRVQKLKTEDKMSLLRVLASHGHGLAFRNIELFEVIQTEANKHEFEHLFLMDATAGYSIYGSLAFLNANKLRPNLQEIEEFELPERATSAMLKNSKDAMKAKFPKDEERISESDRILNAVRESEKNQEPVSLTNVKFQTKQLQNELAEEFLDRLSYQIGKYWKSEYSEVAKNVVFADKQLIIRQVIFLITNGLIDGSGSIEEIYRKMNAIYGNEGLEGMEKMSPISISQRFGNRGIVLSPEKFSIIRNHILKGKGTHYLKEEFPKLCEAISDDGIPTEQTLYRYFFCPSSNKLPQEEIYQYSCWHYFLQKLGVDPDFLFNPNQFPSGSPAIELVKPSTIRFLLNPLMSVYIRSGDSILKSMKIVWRSILLDGQFIAKQKGETITETRIIDDLIQQLAKLLQNIDILFTILSPYFGEEILNVAPVLIKQIRKKDDSLQLNLESGEIIDNYAKDDLSLLVMKKEDVIKMIATADSLCIQVIKQIAKLQSIEPLSLIGKLPFPQETLGDILGKFMKLKN